MHILIGLALACGLLYLWLIGHWFGRVLAFIVFAILLGGIGGFATGHGVGMMAFDPLLNILAIVGGVALAWPVACIPIYVERANKGAASRRAAARG